MQRRLQLIAIVSLAVSLCACSNVRYVDSRTAQLLDAPPASYFASRETLGKPRYLGAFVLSEPGSKLNEGKVFFISRANGRYMAETMLTDNSLDKKAMFDRSYFALGANKKTSSLGFQLRFEF